MTVPPGLAKLRQQIDAIDREVLALFAKRQAVVEKIADEKRAHSLRIRDVAREREVLDARLAEARALGLPESLVESVFQQLLVASRELQSTKKVEVRPEVEPKTIAILGAHGGMGRLFTRLFEELGHTVLAVDLDTELTAIEAAKRADVVVVSVPIRETEVVVRAVGPVLRDDALIVDLTSLKSEPLRWMLESTRASVIGTHPMFGPGVHTFQGQRVVICPGRGDAWLAWLRTNLEAVGLVVTPADPVRHDRAMALVQVLTHYQTQVLGLTLARYGVPIDEPLAFTSPAYLLELYVTARHFAQAASLYGPIEMFNPETPKVTATFAKAAADIAKILETQDQAAFDRLFDEVSTFFGDFTNEALEQSGFLIDRLVELTTGRAGTDDGTDTKE